MKRLFTASVALGALFFAGCTPVAKDPTTAEPVAADPTDSVVEPVADEIEHRWVQDLWIYETVSMIDDSGSIIDLTDQILAELDAGTGEEHSLPGEASLIVYSVLNPAIVDADGERRSDVDVIAGILVEGEARGVAILATPDSDATAPIGLDDSVELDLTFIEELSPGDAMAVDLAFLQTQPGPAPGNLSSIELLAHRLEAGQAQYYGDPDGVRIVPMHLGQAVEGSTRGQLPAKSDPMMDGFNEGLDKCKGDHKCVANFFAKFGVGVSDSMKLIDCNLGGPCGDPPPTTSTPDAVPTVECVDGKCTVVRGDPHMTNLAGHSFSMQAVGEFVGLQSEEFELHVRTSPWNESRIVSMLTAVAVRADDTSATMELVDGELRIRANGQDIALEVGSEHAVGDLTLTGFASAAQIVTSSGDTVTVQRSGPGHLALWVNVTGSADLTGMLADSRGALHPLLSRDGTAVADAADAAFHETFVNSWRVTDEESLFTYDPGFTTADFTDLTFPDVAVTLETLPAKDRARAQGVCTAVGIESPQVLAECIFDFAVTGSMELVRGAREADLIDGFATGRLAREPAQEADPSTALNLWGATASEHPLGAVVRYECSPRGEFATVWGGTDGIYTADSSVCSAAVHQGVITVERGGTVEIERTEGLEDYGSGTTQNGVTTRDWTKPWSGSFIINPEAQ